MAGRRSRPNREILRKLREVWTPLTPLDVLVVDS